VNNIEWFWFKTSVICEKILNIAQKRLKNKELEENPCTNLEKKCYTSIEKSKVDVKGVIKMDAMSVAKYIVSRAYFLGKPISNLKLQKLLYFVWVEFLKRTGQYLFDDEICAWQLGPVVPDVYYEFCPYGGIPIRKNYDIVLDSSTADIINNVIDELLDKSAYSLVYTTHKPGTPWSLTYKDGTGNKHQIPFELIRSIEC
jgi:uncharacterized phage-associated protein